MTAVVAGSCKKLACGDMGGLETLVLGVGDLDKLGVPPPGRFVSWLLFERRGMPTPESARSDPLSRRGSGGGRLKAVPGREAGRELGADLEREVGTPFWSSGRMGQSRMLFRADRSVGDRSPSLAVANVSNVLTVSADMVRLWRFRSISRNRSGVSGVGGG